MVTIVYHWSLPAILEVPGVTVCDEGSFLFLLVAAGTILAAPKAFVSVILMALLRKCLDLRKTFTELQMHC